MKGWPAVVLALALGVAPAARSAQPPAADLNGAAAELARKTAAWLSKTDAVSISWRNLSSLGSAALGQVRAGFEDTFRQAGGHLSEIAPSADAQITLSENQTQFLLVEEIRKGEEHQVWMAAWSRSAVQPAAAAALVVAHLVWEQPEQMLDVAVNGDVMLVLTGTGMVRFAQSNGSWRVNRRFEVATAKPWPRDLRGHLRWNGDRVQVNLPGLSCSGAPDAMECHTSDDPWTLDSGRSLLLATLAPGRNYFDGRVVTQSGTRKTVPPFYSAAAADDGGRSVWLLATVDAGTQMFDAALDPIGPAGTWGSDIVGTDLRCGGHSVVLATRPDDSRGPDAISAYTIVNRAALAAGAPAEFPGPVTALWPASGGAMAIVKNGSLGLYQAYAVTVACGQ